MSALFNINLHCLSDSPVMRSHPNLPPPNDITYATITGSVSNNLPLQLKGMIMKATLHPSMKATLRITKRTIIRSIGE